MKIKDIIQDLETWAPRRYQESYDNSGLLVGDSEVEVSGVMVCLDVTEDILSEAKSKNCNLIVAHHPIIFKGLKKLTGGHYTERIVIQAIQNDLAIYAIHTNLDNQYQGVNQMIGQKLGLNNLEILRPMKDRLKKLATYVPHAHTERVMNAMFEAGAGEIGDYGECSFRWKGKGTFKAKEGSSPFVGEIGERHSEEEDRVEVIFPEHLASRITQAMKQAHPYEEVAFEIYKLDQAHEKLGAGMIGELENPMKEEAFFSMVKEKMEVQVIRHTGFLGKPIQKIAFCGGSGFFLLEDAKASGAQVYITSDVKYHEFMEADQDLILMDIGHFESEHFTSLWIRDYLAQKFHTFAVLLADQERNPINYF